MFSYVMQRMCGGTQVQHAVYKDSKQFLVANVMSVVTDEEQRLAAEVGAFLMAACDLYNETEGETNGTTDLPA